MCTGGAKMNRKKAWQIVMLDLGKLSVHLDESNLILISNKIRDIKGELEKLIPFISRIK